MKHSLLSADDVLGKVHWAERCVLCLTWLYGLFVRTLMSLTNAYTGCGRPTLNFIERFDLGRSVPTAKPLHVGAQRTCMHRMSTSLAWVWTWWCFGLIVLYYILLLFFVLFYATQVKRQKIWLLFWNSDFVVIIICCQAMKMKESVEQMTLDLFQSCNVPKEVSVTLIQR